MKAMFYIFFSKERNQWMDYNFKKKKFCSATTPISNFIPLWTKAYETEGKRAVDLQRVLVEFQRFHSADGEAPVAVTDCVSLEQWDFPNAWSPMVHMMVGGLEKTGLRKGKRMARELASNWIKKNYGLFKKTGNLLERVNVLNDRENHEMGEYSLQKGFGWTNGVLLDLLYRYGDEL